LNKSHGAKAIYNKFTNPEWREKIQKTLLLCVKQCEGDLEKIVLALDKFLKHWIGDHSECLKQGHQCEIKPRLDIHKIWKEFTFKNSKTF
jgi:hypothetical protein